MSRRHKRQNSNGFTLLLLAGAVYYINADLIIDLLPKIAMVIASVTALIVIFKLVNRTPSSKMYHIDRMNGVEFELYIARLLRKLDYKHVRMTEKYDLGIDIIAYKDGVVWGIQVKRYSSIIGLNAVRQAYTALSHYGCTRAMVVSNSTYSNPAKILAHKTNTVLVDHEQLIRWIKQR